MSVTQQIQQHTATIQQQLPIIKKLEEELKKSIVGQHTIIERLLIGLLSNGHILLEGVPGLAKTLTIKSLAQAVQAQFSRIQFTPDLLPADVIGTMIYHQAKNEFFVRKGPIFANFILADEINRAPAKVQSALLEAMQEKQVTIGTHTYPLPNPFLVLATQNPLEQEGTYVLPEAQVDRFMLKVLVDYPSKEEERKIIQMQVNQLEMPVVQPIITADTIGYWRKLVQAVYMDEKIEQYIVDIIFATRFPQNNGLTAIASYISYGGSPRASINLALAAKAYAFLQGRGYVVPDDIKAIAADVLRHRIGLTYEAEAADMSADKIVARILNTIAVP